MIEQIRIPNITFPEVPVTLQSTDESEVEDPQSPGEMMQTQYYGIKCPLVAINDIVIDFPDIEYFELDGEGPVPSLKMEFRDRKKLFTSFEPVGRKNKIHVQILPPFDDTYKKIEILFYVDKFTFGDVIEVSGVYYAPDLTNSQFISLGEKTTYELFDKVSTDTGLGFASNIRETDDKRFIYSPHSSWASVLGNEIKNSSADETHVYDWWIDLWNNLTLCDIFERYNASDDVEENPIWIADHINTTTTHDKPVPVAAARVFTNLDLERSTELYVTDYENVVQTGTDYNSGHTRVISIYNENTKEYVDHMVGDETEDTFVKYEYGGEVYGDYDYIFSSKCRDQYLKLLKGDTIKITLQQPTLGLLRGEQIRFVWYDNDSGTQAMKDMLKDTGALEEDPDLGWLKDWVEVNKDPSQSRPLSVNLNVSGQYTIIGQKMIYDPSGWQYILTLTRPEKQTIHQLKRDEEEQQ